MTREYRGKSLREWHKGHNMQKDIAVAVPFMAVARTTSAGQYGQLESQAEREGYFDGLLEDIERAKGRWANFYALAELLQREEWYWRAQGFDSFAEFWRARTGQTFEALAQMESIYRYAQMADPDLFHLTFDEAAQQVHLKQLVETLSQIAPAGGYGGNRGNRYTGKAQAQGDLARAAIWKAPSGNGIERRFSTLRRNSPAIANRLLAGDSKYFNATEYGCTINWKQVEQDSGVITGKKPKKGAPQTPPKPVDTRKDTINALTRILNTKDARLRKMIIATLHDSDWFAEQWKEANEAE